MLSILLVGIGIYQLLVGKNLIMILNTIQALLTDTSQSNTARLKGEGVKELKARYIKFFPFNMSSFPPKPDKYYIAINPPFIKSD